MAQLAEANENLIQPSVEEVLLQYARDAKKRQIEKESRVNELVLAAQHWDRVKDYRKTFLMAAKEKFFVEESDIYGMPPHIRQTLWGSVRRDIETGQKKRQKKAKIISLFYLGTIAPVGWYFGFPGVLFALSLLFSVPVYLASASTDFFEDKKLGLIRGYNTYFREALPEFDENKSSD